jgi:rhamnosyltransferase
MPRWKELEASSIPFVQSDVLGLFGSPVPLADSVSRRALVIIHAYDPDLLGRLFKRFLGLSSLGDLIVSTDTEEKASRIKSLHRCELGGESRLQVEVTPNLGRDVLPFWSVLGSHGKGYDFFLKLHLKKSAHWEDLGYWNASLEGRDAGSAWNDDCFDCLIPSSDVECRSVLKWMADQRLGALFPRPHRIVERFGWGSEQNMVIATQILADLGCDPLNLLRPLFFPAGNMFWGSMESFLPLVPYFTKRDHYPDEPVPLDGTFLHAVERCYGYVLKSAGFSTGYLFPRLIDAPSSGLRGLEVAALIPGSRDEPGPWMDVLRLHTLYTSPAKRWHDRAERRERKLKALQDVMRQIEGTPWRRLKARLGRLRGSSMK